MKTQFKQTLVSSSILLVALASTYIVGCSKVSFSPTPESCGSGCSFVNQKGSYDYSYTVKATSADILFVVDNSASMSPLQTQLGNKFSSFFNQISNLDYQIGVTTTDISGNTAPYAGQAVAPIGGNLVRFSDGTSILRPGSTNVASQFQTAVVRQETVNCQSYIYPLCTTTSCTGPYYSQKCPSEDTRAIYAANLALSVNGGSGLFRGSDVPLDIVILSNADERTLGGPSQQVPNAPALESNDLAQTLISNVQAQFPGKQLKVHSLVIKPGDTSCFNSQDQRNQNPSRDLFGWYGNIYNQAAASTGGVSQSICGTFDLTTIGQSVNSDDGSRDLACQPNMSTLKVTMTLNGSPVTGIGYSVVTNSSGGYRLKLSSTPQPNTSVRVTFSCQ